MASHSGVTTVLVMEPSPVRAARASRVVVNTGSSSSLPYGRRSSVVSIVRTSSQSNATRIRVGSSALHSSRTAPLVVPGSSSSSLRGASRDSFGGGGGGGDGPSSRPDDERVQSGDFFLPDTSEAVSLVHHAFRCQVSNAVTRAQQVLSTAQLLFTDVFDAPTGTGIFSTRQKRQRVPLGQVKSLHSIVVGLTDAYGAYAHAATLSILPLLSKDQRATFLDHLGLPLSSLAQWCSELKAISHQTKLLKNKFVVRSNLSSKAAKVHKARLALNRERQSHPSAQDASFGSDTIKRVRAGLGDDSNRDILLHHRRGGDGKATTAGGDDEVYIPELKSPESLKKKKKGKKSVRVKSKGMSPFRDVVNENGIHQFAILANHEAEGTWSIRTLHRDQVSVNVISFLANEAHSALSNKQRRQAMFGAAPDRTGSQVKGAMDAREFFRTAAMYKKRHEAASAAKEKQRESSPPPAPKETASEDPWREEQSEINDKEFPMLDILDPDEFKSIPKKKSLGAKRARRRKKPMSSRPSKLETQDNREMKPKDGSSHSVPLPDMGRIFRSDSNLSEGSTVRFAADHDGGRDSIPKFSKTPAVRALEKRLESLQQEYKRYEARMVEQESSTSQNDPIAIAQRVATRLGQFAKVMESQLDLFSRVLLNDEDGGPSFPLGGDGSAAHRSGGALARVACVNALMGIAQPPADGANVWAWLVDDALEKHEAVNFACILQSALPMCSVHIWSLLPVESLEKLRSHLTTQPGADATANSLSSSSSSSPLFSSSSSLSADGKGKEALLDGVLEAVGAEMTPQPSCGGENPLDQETRDSLVDALDRAGALQSARAKASTLNDSESSHERVMALWQRSAMRMVQRWTLQMQRLCLELSRDSVSATPTEEGKVGEDRLRAAQNTLDDAMRHLCRLEACSTVLSACTSPSTLGEDARVPSVEAVREGYSSVSQHVYGRLRSSISALLRLYDGGDRTSGGACDEDSSNDGESADTSVGDESVVCSRDIDDDLIECVGGAALFSHLASQAMAPCVMESSAASRECAFRLLVDAMGGLDGMRNVLGVLLSDEDMVELEGYIKAASL